MSAPPRVFLEFVQWLRARSEEFAALGATVDFQVNDAPRASVRLRIERANGLGELTVWNDASAQLAVLELSSGDFIHERDGLSLADDSFAQELGEFFALVMNEK